MLVAYFIRGISGFGSGLIAVPLLAHFLPLTFVVPMILVTDVAASLALGTHTRKHVRWDELRPLIPFSILGVLAGTTLLVNLPEAPLLATLGVFVLLFGVRSVLNLHGTQTVSRRWALPAGLTGGAIGALFGTGGPPYVIYLNHRLHDKGELRATFSGLFLIEGGLRIVVFLVAGLLLHTELQLTILAALPLVALGLFLGNRVHIGLSPLQMQRLIGIMLLVSGTSLLWRAWI
ncbi:MAG: hypothetical protein H6R46_1277 [Proteobacteria bacterium]|nr:hypothetical protein [Pseudomonadota bacterium]